MADIVLLGCVPQDRGRAGQLQQAIEARGWVVERLGLVQSKRDWLEQSRPRIMAAPCVIAVWTVASARDRWTALGADVALERRTLVSVVLDPVELPRAFRGIDSVAIIGWTGDPESAAMDDLTGSLSVMLGPPPRRQAAVAPWRPVPAIRPAAPILVHPAALQLSEPTAPPVLVRPGTVAKHRPEAVPTIRDRPPAESVDTAAPVTPARWVNDAALFERIDALGTRPSAATAVATDRVLSAASADPDPERRVGLLPCIYGWAIAWAIGVTAMGLYLLSGPQGAEAAQIAIANPLYSAVSGAAVGLIGAGFMIFALLRKRVRLSSSQLGFIVFGWGFGGGCGLLATAYLGLPVVARVYGVLGFDYGWVVCWAIAGTLGSAFTWYALRRSNAFLDHRDLAWIVGGFALGALGGWIASWLAVSAPVMVLDWVLAKLITAGPADAVNGVMLPTLSLGLIGAGGGAAFGLGGGLVILGALSRGAWSRDD